MDHVNASILLVEEWLRKSDAKFETRYEIVEASALGLRHLFDIARPNQRIVIEIDGCYLHGHGCQINRASGIVRRRAQDQMIDSVVRQLGWRIERYWQCEVMSAKGCIRKLKPADAIQPRLLPDLFPRVQTIEKGHIESAFIGNRNNEHPNGYQQQRIGLYEDMTVKALQQLGALRRKRRNLDR
jgi:G:T-mismatch repair DNA endonuclease (very short patch repair protein)